eukprot:g37702.t1
MRCCSSSLQVASSWHWRRPRMDMSSKEWEGELKGSRLGVKCAEYWEYRIISLHVKLKDLLWLYDWKKSPDTDVVATLKKQKKNTKDEFDERAKSTIVEFAQQGLNAALFFENKDPRTFVSLVPTSAHTGDGMGNLIAMLVELTQTMLAKRLAYSMELRAQVME